jgi:hypothetical protein
MAISIEDLDQLTGEVRALKSLCLELRDTVEGGIISNNLHADAIKTNNIKDGVITGDKIIADAITAEHIQALAIDASKIAVGTITSDQIEDGTISADKITTGTLTGLQISAGTITAGLLKTGGQAFSHNLTFSSTDLNTVSWTSGTIKTADETEYSIDAGNTGNMAARTYIYLDKGVSETVLQTSTSYDAPLGDEKIPIATAQNSTNNAIFTVFQGGGGVFISGNMIAAHTIAATQIVAGTITATEITVASLASLSATIGTVSAGTISGTRFRIGGGTDEDLYFEDSGLRMYDYGTRHIRIYKSGYAGLDFCLASSTYSELSSTGRLSLKAANDFVVMTVSSQNYYCRSGGVFSMPNLGSNPSGVTGGICMVSGQLKYWNGSAWTNA